MTHLEIVKAMLAQAGIKFTESEDFRTETKFSHYEELAADELSIGEHILHTSDGKRLKAIYHSQRHERVGTRLEVEDEDGNNQASVLFNLDGKLTYLGGDCNE